MEDALKWIASILMLLTTATCGRDWQEAATADIQRMHAVIRADHPAAVDRDNPTFSKTLETAYRDAIKRAQRVENAAGYLYAVRSFTIPFHDEHLAINFFERMDRQIRYPGFVVSWVDERVVVVRRDDADAPQLGAVLVSCDGVSVEQMVAERIKPYVGNWALPSKRAGDAPLLLIDADNPFIPVLSQCVFSQDGVETKRNLKWRDLSDDGFNKIIAAFEPRAEAPIGMRTTSNGSIWISLGSLDVTDGKTASAIKSLHADIRARHDKIAAAPRIVVDVRGNVGGSSAPGVELAQALFGDADVSRAIPRIEGIDWRASAGNLGALNKYLPLIEQAFGAGSPTFTRMKTVRDGMQKALSGGQPYFRQTMTYPDKSEAAPVPHPPVYLLTDSFCVSACLDFVDLMLRIDGVIQVGRATSGDTRYLEVRTEPLPSGIAQLSLPAAAHRGRQRQDNEIHVPTVVWEGNIADTAALEAWIASLPQQRGD
jgi:hypothetical protein